MLLAVLLLAVQQSVRLLYRASFELILQTILDVPVWLVLALAVHQPVLLAVRQPLPWLAKVVQNMVSFDQIRSPFLQPLLRSFTPMYYFIFATTELSLA